MSCMSRLLSALISRVKSTANCIVVDLGFQKCCVLGQGNGIAHDPTVAKVREQKEMPSYKQKNHMVV